MCRKSKGGRREPIDDVVDESERASGHFIAEVRVTFNSASLPVLYRMH